MDSKISKYSLLLLLFTSLSISLPAQENIRVMVYNILRYGATGFPGCSPTSPTDRNNQFIDIVSTASPDIFGVNEIGPFDGAFSPASNVSINVLPNVPGKGAFYEAAEINFDGNQDICNMLWYNSQKLGLSEQAFISASNARNIDYYRFYYKSAGNVAASDTVFLHVFLAHYMASSSSGRVNQSNAIINFLNSRNLVSSTDNYLLMGDLNESSPNSNSMQALFNPSGQPTRDFKDPLGLTNWNQSYVWSQSTRSNSSGDCGAGGGLDDRFDNIFVSDALLNNTSDFSYVPGSYWVFGNDDAPNPSLPALTKVNLIGLSDHYPVIVDLQVSQAVANDEQLSNRVQVQVGQLANGENYLQTGIPGGLEGIYEMTITDLQGKVLQQWKQELYAGVQRSELQLHGASGLLILNLEKPGQEPIRRKFIRMD